MAGTWEQGVARIRAKRIILTQKLPCLKESISPSLPSLGISRHRRRRKVSALIETENTRACSMQ
uniref:Uncharacterized protein n=1 Tax=Cucumis melo TaxID=3656 RepID=A0A9I9CS51_CUCME